MLATKDWLANLQPGEEVAVRRGYANAYYRLEKVVRVTPAHVVLPHDCRYRKADGDRVGNRFSSDSIVPATEEIRTKIRRSSIVSALSAVKWETLPLEKLETVLSAVVSA